MKNLIVLLFLFGLFTVGFMMNVNNNFSYFEDDLEGDVLE